MQAALSSPILDFLAEIYHLQSISSLSGIIVREMPRIIPCDNVMVGSHDGTRRVLTGLVLRQPFSRTQFLAEANQTGLMAVHPFWECLLDPGRPLKILSDMSPGHRWLENPLYHEVLREDRVRDHLNVEFGPSIADFTSVSVIRSSVGFGKKECKHLELLRPHLAQAFSNARIVDQTGIANAQSESSHTSSFSISLEGYWLTPTNREKAYALLGNSGQLLARLERWLTLAADQLNRGNHAAAKFQIRHGARISAYQLQRDWLHRRYRLLHRLTSGPGELLGQPLSKKEHEILFWIAEGKSNPEIATFLAISPETVKTHLKRIFRKLGVDNRTAAANFAR